MLSSHNTIFSEETTLRYMGWNHQPVTGGGKNISLQSAPVVDRRSSSQEELSIAKMLSEIVAGIEILDYQQRA